MPDMYIWDIEANGLIRELKDIWILSYKLAVPGAPIISLTPDELSADTLYKFFGETDAIYIGHNILGYDLPALEKVYGLDLDILTFDTMVFSRLLYPDRTGGHSLDNLSNGAKIKFNDFSRYSEEMRVYCEGDVKENAKVLGRLCRELSNRSDSPSPDSKTIIERCATRYKTSEYQHG